MHKHLSRKYVCRLGRPTIHMVDVRIFRKTYFAECMKCTYCNDMCCGAGVDIDVDNIARLEPHVKKLGKLVQHPREQWFEPKIHRTKEYPGGAYTRTQVVDGTCIFLNRSGRGCLLHQYCLEQGLDYRELKPLICSIFPVTFGDGLLLPASEVIWPDIDCLGPGKNLYEAVRDDLGYYFGQEFIAELDEIQRVSLHRSALRAARLGRTNGSKRVNLPMV